MEEPVLWTIGHSNHSLERFFSLLQENRIQILADVRTHPRSRFSPQFNGEFLREGARQYGIDYHYFGDTLGGRPGGAAFYDEDGHVRYDEVAASRFFQDGIARLERGVRRGFRVAIMCSEENPNVCHRHLLVGRVIARRGVTLRHIRGDGQVQTDDDLLRLTDKLAAAGQANLFEGYSLAFSCH